VKPEELRRLGRAELRRYGVRTLFVRVLDVRRDRGGFGVRVAGGGIHHARKLLLATGVRDHIPAIPGIDSLFGVSVHICPFCDGWEWRERRLAVYGRGQAGAGLAHSLLAWSRDVVLLTDGPSRLEATAIAALRRRGVVLHSSRIVRFEGRNGRLRRVHFRRGTSLERDAIFLATRNEVRGELARRLDCRLQGRGPIWTDRRECSSVPGVYVTGDASGDVQFSVVAAAEGARAAVAIHKELVQEERHDARRRTT
jgi:thioredoxin reductase